MDKKRSEMASEYFEKGYNCAQSVLYAFKDVFNLNEDLVQGLGGGLGGGLGKMGLTCGAVMGAFILIGLKYGKRDRNDNQAKEKTYEKVRHFNQLFKEKNGSIVCNDLLGYDITKQEDMAVIKEKGLFKTVCTQAIIDALDILEKNIMT